MSWFQAWLGYGIGRGIAKATLGGDRPRADPGPIRSMTEEQIRADEKRFDEEAKRLDAEDAAAKR